VLPSNKIQRSKNGKNPVLRPVGGFVGSSSDGKIYLVMTPNERVGKVVLVDRINVN
jgi:hypothetical protein